MEVRTTRYEAPLPANVVGRGALELRNRTATGDAPGGQPRLDTPKAYRCGKCGAEPGQPCRRWVGGRVGGRDIGGGYWRTQRTLHPGRRPRDAGIPD